MRLIVAPRRQIAIVRKAPESSSVQILLADWGMAGRLLFLLVVFRLDGHAPERVVEVGGCHIQRLRGNAAHRRAVKAAMPPRLLRIAATVTGHAAGPTLKLPPTLARPYRRGNRPCPQCLEIDLSIEELVSHGAA